MLDSEMGLEIIGYLIKLLEKLYLKMVSLLLKKIVWVCYKEWLEELGYYHCYLQVFAVLISVYICSIFVLYFLPSY